jgi:restriction system protein
MPLRPPFIGPMRFRPRAGSMGFASAPPQALVAAQEIGFGVALIEPGQPTDEGVLIAAVTPAWRRFLKLLADDPQAFMQLDSRQMEELIAGGYEQDGWTVTLTPRSGDGGKDVIAVRHDVGAIRVLDQVKRYGPGLLVNADEVRAMWGVLSRDHLASKAVISTSSSFAPGVFDEFKDSMPTRLELRNGEQVREWLAKLENG